LSNRQGGVVASPCYQKFFYFAGPQSIFIGALRVEGDSMASNDRKNGKAYKKKPKVQKKTGKTIDGYSPSKLAIRAKKRGK